MVTLRTKLATMLIILALCLGLLATSVQGADSSASRAAIDVFTQKDAPYSGRGANMPSDAFGPDQQVFLFGLVTYNGNPVVGNIVAFEIMLPNSSSFTLSSETNSNGIAFVSFSTPKPGLTVKETDIFGVWFVSARTSVNGIECQDALSFRMNWVIKLLSVETISENLTNQSEFGWGGDVGLKITMRSIAMSLQSATIAIVVYDELKVPISHQNIPNFYVPPNMKPISLYTKLYLPKVAYVGKATVFVSALTDPQGVPYCPEISTNFGLNPKVSSVTLGFVDAATVYVSPSSQTLKRGEPLNVTVVVANEGTETINFNVIAYCGNFLIGASHVESLSPFSAMFLNMPFDTSPLSVGNYALNASIPALSNETDLADNAYSDGFVSIEPNPYFLFHEITVLRVQPSVNLALVGDVVDININVQNDGNYTESFNVTAFYNTSVIGTAFVNNLQVGASKNLVIHWSTTNVAEGNYTISALVSLASGENNIGNGHFIDGIVSILKGPRPESPITWFFNLLWGFCQFLLRGFFDLLVGLYNLLVGLFSLLCGFYRFLLSHFWWFLLLLLLALIVALLIAWFARRRRLKKKLQGSFDSAWTAWYYGDGLKSKMP